jgi:hypothetical protein
MKCILAYLDDWLFDPKWIWFDWIFEYFHLQAIEGFEFGHSVMSFTISFHNGSIHFGVWFFCNIEPCKYFFQLTLDCIYRSFAENPHIRCSAWPIKLNFLLSVSQSSNFTHLDFDAWSLNFNCFDFDCFHAIFWISFSWMSCFCSWSDMNPLKFLMKATFFNIFIALFGLFANFLSQHDGSPCIWVDYFLPLP